MTLDSPLKSPLIDRSGRPVTYLRVSVTDRCNLRCRYCMPAAGVKLYPKERLLTFEDITFFVRQAANLGIHSLRITGGEPLLRRNVSGLVAELKAIQGIREVAMTTNATLLPKHAEALRAAGLDRINISLDSLSSSAFESMTRFSLLEEALAGIRAAEDAGFGPLKINAVLLKGYNTDELERWVELTRTRAVHVRFLELMPIGEGHKLFDAGHYQDVQAVCDRLVREFELVPAEVHGNGPARSWRIAGAPGTLGFITPLSNPYCDTCTRFRLTSTGEIRPCLAEDVHVDAHSAIRARDEAAIVDALRRAAQIKPSGHRWAQGHITELGMSTLGG